MRRLLLGMAALGLSALPASASTVLGLSIEDQARLSRHVVLGTVVSQVGVDDPEMGIETEITLRVRRDLKGVAEPGELLVFHIRSGQVGSEISTAVGEAEFQTGRPTLVFLEEIDGRLYNLGLSMGVWNVLESHPGRVTLTRALQDGLEVVGDTPIEYGPLSLDRMVSRVAGTLASPEFDHPALRQAFLGRN
jgi:hypothetical protein